MALKQAQKDFIKKKCRELGSIEEVERFYRPKNPEKPCGVDLYAIKMANKIYNVYCTCDGEPGCRESGCSFN